MAENNVHQSKTVEVQPLDKVFTLSSKFILTGSDGSRIFRFAPEDFADDTTVAQLYKIYTDHQFKSIDEFIKASRGLNDEEWADDFSQLLANLGLCLQLQNKYKEADIHYINKRLTIYGDHKNADNVLNERCTFDNPGWLFGNLCDQFLDRCGRLPVGSTTCYPIDINKNLAELRHVSGINFKKLPKGVCIAGGYMASVVFGRTPEDRDPSEDIDLWITGPTEKERKFNLETCLEWLGDGWIYSQRRSALTLINTQLPNCPNIQVMYSNFVHPGQLIASFDLPMVKVYYDGSEVVMTRELLAGLKAKEFIIQTSVMTSVRWVKLHRYPGITYHIIVDAKDKNNTHVFEKDFNLSAKDIWCATPYGYTFQVPKELGREDRYKLCLELFKETKNVYDKYYKFDRNFSLEHNLVLAKKALNADDCSYWNPASSFANYDVNWHNCSSLHCSTSEDFVNVSSVAEAATSSDMENKNNKNNNNNNNNNNYENARFNIKVNSYLKIRESMLEQDRLIADTWWKSLWKYLNFDVQSLPSKFCTLFAPRFCPQLLIPKAKIILHRTQNPDRLQNLQYMVRIELPKSHAAVHFLMYAQQTFTKHIIKLLKKKDIRYVGVNGYTIEMISDRKLGVVKDNLFIFNCRLNLQKKQISKIMETDLLISFADAIIKNNLYIRPRGISVGAVTHKTAKFDRNIYRWPSIHNTSNGIMKDKITLT